MKRVMAREIQQGFTPADHLRIECKNGELETQGVKLFEQLAQLE